MNQPTIDLTVFTELQDVAGADFAAELAVTFMEEAPVMLVELRRAQVTGNADTFRRAAHSLKSNGLTFGASTLADMARELEQGGLSDDTRSMDALELEYQRVAAALTELCRG